MPSQVELETNLQRLVSEVVDTHVASVREDLVRRILQQVQDSQPAGDASALPLLESAVAAIHRATSQSEILRALLDGAARFSGRVGLFVIRGGSASGWQARGLQNDAAISGLTLDLSRGLAARAMRDFAPVSGPASEFDPAFLAAIGAPAKGEAVVLPLIVREKVAALICADSGLQPAGTTERSALQLLVRSAGLWLEVLSLRRGAHGTPSAGERPVGEGLIAPTEKVVESVGSLTSSPPPLAEVEVAAPAAEPSPSPDDLEMHAKAQRFARLLVDEIKLYNSGKVAEGRQHKDLYKRLKEDIEKSRAAYDKRYGNTVAAGANYFTQELIRNLAEGDTSLLGSNFPG